MSYDRGYGDRDRDFRGGDGRDHRGDPRGPPRDYGPPRDFRGGDSRDFRGGPGGGGSRDFRGDRDFRGGNDRDFRPGYGGPPRGRRDDAPSGGAGHLTRIFGTEEDRVNCPFYYKTGACRHGERCSRQHHRPMMSQTVMLPHMYQNPEAAVVAQYGTNSGHQLDARKVQDELEDFYEEVFEEFAKIGHVEDMVVLDNLSDHLVGNVYVKFTREEDSLKALQVFNGRFYAGRQLAAELSPVTDFKEARCRQFVDGTCKRGHFCNFMHVKKISQSLIRELQEEQPHAAEESESESEDDEDDRKRRKKRKEKRRSRSRSGSRDRRRRRSRSRGRSRRSRSGDRKSRHRDRDKRKRSRSRDRSGDAAGAEDADGK